VKRLWIVLAIISLAFVGALAQEDTSTEETQEATEPLQMVEGETLLDIIANDPEFSTLFTAIQAAGLAEQLEMSEYTVFAPTNDAFDALPEGELEALLADPIALEQLLLNHLVIGAISSGELIGFGSVTTGTGEFLIVNPSTDGIVDVGDAVASEIIEASNGVIYVIDTVLVPSGTPDEDTGN
jgi:uncharacterized surface protein with fasciclin (FAS1) repeats